MPDNPSSPTDDQTKRATGSIGHRQSSLRAFRPSFEDPREADLHMACLVEALERPKVSTMSFGGYFACCLVATSFVSAVTIALLSSMGVGKDVLEFLQDNEWLWYPLIGAAFWIFVLLYLFDFFAPPHLPGVMLRLYNGDVCVGRSLCVLGVLLLYASCFFLANTNPSLPVVMAVALLPVVVALVRLVTKPKPVDTSQLSNPLPPLQAATQETDMATKPSVNVSDLRKEATAITALVGHEEDVGIFHRAVLAAFTITALLSLGVWLVWAITDGQAIDEIDESHLTNQDRQELWILWCTPLVVAICNFVFALFSALRVVMHRVYMDTVPDGANVLETKYEQAIRHVSTVVKSIGCFLIVTLGFLYVGAQLLYTDNEIASMVINLLFSLFVLFVVFTYLAFNRVVMATSKWLSELAVWNFVAAVLKSDWFRALVVCILLVPTPGLLLLSFATQCMRKCRRLYSRYPAMKEDALKDELPDPGTLVLTPRVHNVLRKVRLWNRISVITRCYILCAIFFAYVACPLPLNISLAWMQDALQDVNFGIIIVLTFIIGVSAFLLPPVPGMTIYIFGGLMLSSTCPIGGKGSDTAFWIGALINIGLGWFLKLVACAIQQVCIGGMLGKSIWVRQTVGVHKVSVRCIEKELQRPGLPLGKVAILCGGPDWPTSVLAGVLGLSLLQCELGTLPIILFVAPCSLTGSFYIKKGTSEIWTRAANLMVMTSVIVNLTLWAIAAWAIQNQLERNFDELTRPLPDNVHLAWLDFKDEQLKQSASVTWEQVPSCIKFVFALGVFVQILLCVLFQFQYSLFFKYFEVQDPIDNIDSWEDVITYAGLAAVAAFFLCYLGWYALEQWRKSATRAARQQVEHKLKAQEEEWKADWVEKAKNWTPPDRSSQSQRGSEVKAEEVVHEDLRENSHQKTEEESTKEPADFAPVVSLDKEDSQPMQEDLIVPREQPLAAVYMSNGGTTAWTTPVGTDEDVEGRIAHTGQSPMKQDPVGLPSNRAISHIADTTPALEERPWYCAGLAPCVCPVRYEAGAIG